MFRRITNISFKNNFYNPSSLVLNQQRFAFRKSKVEEAPPDVNSKDAHDDFVKKIWLLMPKEKAKLSPKETKSRFLLARRKVMNELREHNIRSKNELIRIKLKWAAVNALPTPCREAALIPDLAKLPDIPLLADYPDDPPGLEIPNEEKTPEFRWKFINEFE